jgi:hypothetical protein
MITTPGGKVATNQLNQNVPIQLGSKIIKTTFLILGWILFGSQLDDLALSGARCRQPHR